MCKSSVRDEGGMKELRMEGCRKVAGSGEVATNRMGAVFQPVSQSIKNPTV